MKNIDKAIKQLIQLNLDSAKGYKVAAENTNDTGLSNLLNKTAIERETNMKKLSQIAGQSAGHPSFTAELHQFWVNLITASKKFDSSKIVHQCISEDKELLKIYIDILNKNQFDDNLSILLTSQKNNIKVLNDQLQNIIDKYREIDDEKNRETPVQ